MPSRNSWLIALDAVTAFSAKAWICVALAGFFPARYKAVCAKISSGVRLMKARRHTTHSSSSAAQPACPPARAMPGHGESHRHVLVAIVLGAILLRRVGGDPEAGPVVDDTFEAEAETMIAEIM